MTEDAEYMMYSKRFSFKTERNSTGNGLTEINHQRVYGQLSETVLTGCQQNGTFHVSGPLWNEMG